MTVWLDDAKLIQRITERHTILTWKCFKSSSTVCLIHQLAPLCHLHWDPDYYSKPLHILLDICFSPNADENRPSSVRISYTLSLIPQGSFWRRQTGVLLMVQGTVWENTSWIMERTVDVLQKATVRQGCLTTASVPFKNRL